MIAGLADLRDALARAERYAPFVKAAMSRQPGVAAMLADGDLVGAFAEARVPVPGPLRRELRVQRDRLALVLATGDLAGVLDLQAVTHALSDFADHALDAAIADAIRSRTPDADPCGFSAIALGKHGSRELNYSSDIDPILIFHPHLLPRRERDDPGEAAVRVARHIVDLLQTRDGDGYVFRVDLRLRPASEATPLAIPIDAAISHYESSALAWERAAFVRARAAAGDMALGTGFLSAIQAFVWRRSLDFGAVSELRSLSQRIRAHHAAGQQFGPGFDLKRGRGGIREVEFYVQIQQLIHGGRNPALRVPDTLGAIAALATAGTIDRNAANTLDAAYRLYRTIEHRLQMVDDRQTHSLPRGDALDEVAALHGLADSEALLALLAPHVEAVGALYDGLDGADTPATISFAAFPDPSAAERRVSEWRGGGYRALRTAPAQAAMEKLLPGLMAAFAQGPDANVALLAFDRILSSLPTALNLFTLLDAQPPLRTLLVAILSHAPALADALAARPALLDRLIDASALETVESVAALTASMKHGETLEDRLDRVRLLVSEHRFALGVQIVEGSADPLHVAAGYARVAEAALVSVADAVVADFADRHGRVPRSELVVLALGRLGGGALTHASDLDLIYLFSGNFNAESDGAKPLGATHYYNRLAQRLSAGLSAPTSVGALYEIDTRLRPSGAQGPLVVSFDSFARYQREEAWTWEHMALTRARPVYGSATARQAIAEVIKAVLERPRERATLRRDVITMRAEIARHKPPLGPFDVKLGAGGLVDYEFALQYRQLAGEVAFDARLPVLDEAHALLTRLLVTLRLVSPSMEAPLPVTRPIVARACGAADWDELLERLALARQEVGTAWAKVTEDRR
jgi:[glutamine synthetase] adenylyltransferase / [glutamine synthetase]-adenylyl-L-tyrosine phosphorylase